MMRHSGALSDRTRVAVLMGGWSSEREVSLKSGAAVEASLRKGAYDVVVIDPPKDLTRFTAQILTARPDVIFNALHGTGGEDGIIAGALEMTGIPYTHSGVAASAIAMDKKLTKMIAAQSGVKIAEDKIIQRRELAGGHPIQPPYVVKPLNGGSSVGISIIHNDMNEAIENQDPEEWVIVEKYIPGVDLTIGVMETENGPEVLGITEVRPKKGFYDYEAKYTAGMTEYIVNPELPEKIVSQLHKDVLKIHNALGCRDVSRSEFRYNENDGIVFLELNTHPGMTATSLLPGQAKAKNIDFDALVVTLLNAALRRKISVTEVK